jgi:hypothetical protein
MKTTSINIFSLNVPCCNKCRYCLLSWDGTIIGTSYNRSLSFARKFYEWLLNPPKEVENRVLTLSLTKENIDELESKDFEDIIKSLEKQDEKYYSIIPSFNELLTIYCDKNDKKLYTKKDLYMIYRKKYIDEKNIIIKDINDERYSGSIRY